MPETPLRRRLVLPLALLLAAACSDDSAGTDAAPADGGADARLRITFGGDRPVTIRVPAAYTAGKKWPLVLVLHGYSATGWAQEKLLGYDQLVDKKGILLASPDGKVDSQKNQFWNATDACCDFDKSGVDDSAYLSGLIKEIAGVYNIDPARIYLIGHSNGGFMSFRMACDHADTIAAIISLAGSTYNNKDDCKPRKPVSVVQIHGTTDDSIKYQGGNVTQNGKPYPGADQIAAYWASYNGCKATRTRLPQKLDLDYKIKGAETEIRRHDGCPSGIDVELWTMNQSGHLPFPTPDFGEQTWKFFDEHPRP